jgi:hypothetical protein
LLSFIVISVVSFAERSVNKNPILAKVRAYVLVYKYQMYVRGLYTVSVKAYLVGR